MGYFIYGYLLGNQGAVGDGIYVLAQVPWTENEIRWAYFAFGIATAAVVLLACAAVAFLFGQGKSGSPKGGSQIPPPFRPGRI